jgi:hypothetical protein
MSTASTSTGLQSASRFPFLGLGLSRFLFAEQAVMSS